MTKTKLYKTKKLKEVEEYVKERKKNSQNSKKEVENILWKLNKKEMDNNVNYGKEVNQVKLRKTSKIFGN